MDEKTVTIWYDKEADYLEVLFEAKEGYFRETAQDQVMEKVDLQGRVIGFSVLKVSSLSDRPLSLVLSGGRAA